MFEVKGKVALITGALGGIGSEYTKALLREDVKGITIIDISNRLLQKLLDELSSNDQKKVFFIQCNITDITQLEDAYKATIDKFSQLDIVINNAGVFDEIDIEKTLNVNLIATIRSTYMALKTYLPKYRKGEEAVIVNTSSIAGLVPFHVSPVYGATKSGIVSLGISLGTEPHYKLRQVRVITICPGATKTDIFNSMRAPEENKKMLKELMDYSYKNLQSPENLGKALVELLETAPNGTVWVSQNDEPPIQIDMINMQQDVMKTIHMIE